MDPTARTARARLAALVRHRRADDPQLVEARDVYADHRARIRIEGLTPAERRRLLTALTDNPAANGTEAEPVNPQDGPTAAAH